MICWMFPGQPIAFSEIPSQDPEFQAIARLCLCITGFDPLLPLVSHGLPESIRLQLFGTVMSLYRSALLKGKSSKPDIIAEHSMGIYAALAASGAIEPATALELTWRIGACMAEMGKTREYALGSVIGMRAETVQEIASISGAYIANYNTSRHFLLAGERNSIESALKMAAAAGAFSVSTFNCDAPLHTPLIEEISGDLQRIVAEYDFKEPIVPLVEHIRQTTLKAAEIPAFLVHELCGPVFWEKTYLALRAMGTLHFQEINQPPVLAKFNRWIDSDT